MKFSISIVFLLGCCFFPSGPAAFRGYASSQAQQNSGVQEKKVNPRPASAPAEQAEPFDHASVEEMAEKCVVLETDVGSITIEMLPESAPETVRNILNLVGTHALDTTTFSRVVKGFVIQGGDLSTGNYWTARLARRAARTVPDEPGQVKHVRGIVSLARSDVPNTATTHFFILVGDGAELDGKFAAFGRVVQGMDIVDLINKAPLEGEKPLKPVHIKTATLTACDRANTQKGN